MRRADRLFDLLQLLRRRRVLTAEQFAESLEVSVRTVYRDVADLVASGVPIEGEAGVGYRLPRGFDLPPLMFTAAEIEALVLGARMVESWGDEGLARAAKGALARIEAALPDRLRPVLDHVSLFAPQFHVPTTLAPRLTILRSAIAASLVVDLSYRDRQGEPTTRCVRPLGLFYWGHGWTLGAWCELREGFRNFRLDRVVEAAATSRTFVQEAGRTLDDFLAHVRAEAG
ncbi:MAG: YafY family transcriptional regulator [Myxococcales bacterium]|nr:YafY family transcriptional regulator [Myxococcales bacterium]